jgi:hypothetical protein
MMKKKQMENKQVIVGLVTGVIQVIASYKAREPVKEGKDFLQMGFEVMDVDEFEHPSYAAISIVS